MIGIYKITSPSNRIYIGQTEDFELRFKMYKRLHCKNQTRLYNSLIKYSFEKHIFEFIEECLKQELNSKERYWQDYYDVLSKKGLNCVLTQTDILPRVVSEETKLKISLGNKGKLVTKETRMKQSDLKKGRYIGINNPMYNKKHSKESLLKMNIKQSGENNGMYGKHHNLETKLKMSNIRLLNNISSPRCKMVLDLKTGIFYNSAKDASIARIIIYSTLRSKLNGTLKNDTELIYV